MFKSRISYLTFLLITASGSFAADTTAIVETAEQHVRLQTSKLPGKVSITMASFDGTRLPPCIALEAFTPPGSRMIGKTQIGVRCLAPNSWRVLIAANISVTGNYVTINRAMSAGQTIQATDLTTLNGDISSLPAGALNDPANAIGQTLRNSLAPGQVLRADQLLAQTVIKQGQTVRVISIGEGFSATAEGKAINNAASGQVVQVRMSSGQTVSGIAKSDGSVEITF